MFTPRSVPVVSVTGVEWFQFFNEVEEDETPNLYMLVRFAF